MPVFFLPPEQLTTSTLSISGPLLDHFRSLRIKVGEEIVVADGLGSRHHVTVTALSGRVLQGRILSSERQPARAAPSVVLCQALLKGEKLDWVIQKATELGVDRIVPLVTRHSVVRPQPSRMEHQRSRWQRIALEAAQQSERWTVPTVDEPVDCTEVSAVSASAMKLALVERSAKTSLAAVPLPVEADHTVLLLIGPEGGWDEEELRFMAAQGYNTVTLGSRILRAETAAIAALSILQSRLGNLG
ncbi:16S rRNA (uracil(1498)-N(3))-methyltransferase [Nitrospira moscoviensis]|uniref:Ribosomal RNA small subunit methyltransferase E n=1 Tax=Nitrospira moscoviensis TaxID=42253 RepID=A0A0K2GD58_NITMO|nr:16S rRNA (uracil(1498)-N(3))-methyltransferase [Nitrospira moscoviensis]ALA58891.1 Ribosomal RNA small subunit methyltransferase E [Nitrospira moscoviensis]